MRTFISGLALGVLAPLSLALAQSSGTDVLSAFQQYRDVATTRFQVPTVMEIPFDGLFIERPVFAVYDVTAARFEPSLFLQKSAPLTLSAESADGYSPQLMTDGSYQTYTEFPVPGDKAVVTEITLHSQSPISASALSLSLDENVALPSRISITVPTGWEEHAVVLADSPLASTLVSFPRTNSSEWTIRLTHVQPLRITEIRLVTGTTQIGQQSLRFLAQPNHAYRIYFDPDRYVRAPAGESANLADNRDIVQVGASVPLKNSAYTQADVDGDNIPDTRDNCVSTANPDQADVDQNGLGDVCQDFDKDGVPNARDNCPNAPNLNQADTDGDTIGDACDTEESRVTEKYRWIPWAGIGFAGVVIASLFALTVYGKRPEEEITQG